MVGEFETDTERGGTTQRLGSSRRRFLAAAGATGLAGLARWPGATTAAAQQIGTVNYGILNPLTGTFGGLAEGQRNGAELGIQTVNESDEFDFTIEAAFEDTEGNPSIGRRRAQRVVEQEGAQFLMGAISSSTALALNDFAASEGVLYNPGAAAVEITGANCNEWVFRAETNAAQIAEAVAPWVVENLGTNVWFHIADYAYGNSVQQEWSSRMEETTDEFQQVGQSASEVGATNYGNFISQVGNSDAEVVVIGMTGGDLINFVKQAAAQGLKEQISLVSPTMSFQVVREALGPDAYNTWGGVRYVPALETGDNQEFVQAYTDQYDTTPDNFARVAYDSIRMTAQGIQEAGSNDPEAVKDVLPGLEVDSLFGPNQFRECDHQALNPVWSGENVEPSEGEAADVELIERVEGPDAIYSCEESGCQL